MKLTTVFLITICLIPVRLPAAEDFSERLQKGLFEEEANQNLDAAIKNYLAIVDASEQQRKLIATALFRLGECYRKQGRTNDAAAQYQQLVSKYFDQTNLVSISRQHLASLGVRELTTGAKGSAGSSGPNQISAEEAALERLKKYAKDSPDLLNARDSEGDTELVWATQKDYKTVVEFLIQSGADLNVPGRSRTPLQTAASYNRVEIAQLLVAHGADVNSTAGAGVTALHLATVNGYKTIVELLITNKANVNATGSMVIDPGKKKVGGATLSFFDAVAQNCGYQSYDLTPLHLAAFKGHLSLVEILLKAGANINARERQGFEPLHFAAHQGQKAVTELLLRNHADPNGTTKESYTPVRMAVGAGAKEIVELLLKQGADPNISNSNGFSPLHYASTEIAELLLKYKADPNAKGKVGYSPLLLELAVSQQNAEMVKLLLDFKADCNATNNHGQTVLFRCIEFPPENEYSMRIARMLISAGANVNASDINGETALFHAVRGRQQQWVEFLVSNGVDVNVQNRVGKTALSYADSNNTSSSATLVPAQPGYAGIPALAVPGISSRVGGSASTGSANEIRNLLLKSGANEALERMTFIEVRRRTDAYRPFIRNRTNQWDNYTLMEALAELYVSGKRQELFRLQFPDFQNVKVTRWDLQTGRSTVMSMDVQRILETGDCSQDIWLQWGDAIEIPEVEHRTDVDWLGLSQQQLSTLYNCLKRDVSILIKGTEHRVTLIPFSKSQIAYAALPGKRPPVVGVPGNSSVTNEVKVISSFRFSEVLSISRLLLSTSDTTRVRITRTDPVSKEKITFTANSYAEGMPTLYLRDGDILEVPEKGN